MCRTMKTRTSVRASAFAYDLTGSGKHMLRFGYGLYYGQIFQNIPLFMEQQANPTSLFRP